MGLLTLSGSNSWVPVSSSRSWGWGLTDFPGGLVVKTPRFQGRGCGSTLVGKLISHMPHCSVKRPHKETAKGAVERFPPEVMHIELSAHSLKCSNCGTVTMITVFQPCSHPTVVDVATPIFLGPGKETRPPHAASRGWDVDAGLPSQDRGTCGSDVCSGQ